MEKLIYFPLNIQLGKPSLITGITYTEKWLKKQVSSVRGQFVFNYPGKEIDYSNIGDSEYAIGKVKGIEVIDSECYLITSITKDYSFETIQNDNLDLDTTINKIKLEVSANVKAELPIATGYYFSIASFGHPGSPVSEIDFKCFYLINKEEQKLWQDH